MSRPLPSSFASAAAGQSRDLKGGDWNRSNSVGTRLFKRSTASQASTPSTQQPANDATSATSTANTPSNPASTAAQPRQPPYTYTVQEILASFDSAAYVPVPSDDTLPCWDPDANTRPVSDKEKTEEEVNFFQDVNAPLKQNNQHKDGTPGRKHAGSLASATASPTPNRRPRQNMDNAPSFPHANNWFSRQNQQSYGDGVSTSNNDTDGGVVSSGEPDPGSRVTSPTRSTRSSSLWPAASPIGGAFGRFQQPSSSPWSAARVDTQLADLVQSSTLDSSTGQGNNKYGSEGTTNVRHDRGHHHTNSNNTNPNNNNSNTGNNTNNTPKAATLASWRTNPEPTPTEESPLPSTAKPSASGNENKNTHDTPSPAPANLASKDPAVDASVLHADESAFTTASRSIQSFFDSSNAAAGIAGNVNNNANTVSNAASNQPTPLSNPVFPPLNQSPWGPAPMGTLGFVGDRGLERPPFPNVLDNSIFGAFGEASPAAAAHAISGLGSIFTPSATSSGLNSPSGTIGRRSKMESLFPASMQMANQDTQANNANTNNNNNSSSILQQGLSTSRPATRGPFDDLFAGGMPGQALPNLNNGTIPMNVFGGGLGPHAGSLNDGHMSPSAGGTTTTGSSTPAVPGSQQQPQHQQQQQQQHQQQQQQQQHQGVGIHEPASRVRQMVMPDRMRWVYLDPQNQVQGPFTGLEMNDWYKANFFSPDLRVRKAEDTEFEPLGLLIRRIGNSREPFLVPQMGIPHGPAPDGGSFTSSSSGGIVPPLSSVFPTYGRTLTAEEQNNLERRKQEEQIAAAHQREFLIRQQQQQALNKFHGIGGRVPGPVMSHHPGAPPFQQQQPPQSQLPQSGFNPLGGSALPMGPLMGGPIGGGFPSGVGAGSGLFFDTQPPFPLMGGQPGIVGGAGSPFPPIQASPGTPGANAAMSNIGEGFLESDLSRLSEADRMFLASLPPQHPLHQQMLQQQGIFSSPEGANATDSIQTLEQVAVEQTQPQGNLVSDSQSSVESPSDQFEKQQQQQQAEGPFVSNLDGQGNNVAENVTDPAESSSYRSLLPQTSELEDDNEGFKKRLEDFEEYRAIRSGKKKDTTLSPSESVAEPVQETVPTKESNAELAARLAQEIENVSSTTSSANASKTANTAITKIDSASREPSSSPASRIAAARKERKQRIPLSLDDAVATSPNTAQKAVLSSTPVAATTDTTGLPMPFPPPMLAPTAQRAKSSIPEQFAAGAEATASESTPTQQQPPPMAPWAQESVKTPKAPSLKEIQEAEAEKARAAEQAALAARRTALDQEIATLRDRGKTLETGLPSTSMWAHGTAGGSSTPSLTPSSPAVSTVALSVSPWGKAAAGKVPSSSAAAGNAAGGTTASSGADSGIKSLAQIQQEEQARKEKAAAAAALAAANASNNAAASAVNAGQPSSTAATLGGGKRFADFASKAAAAAQSTGEGWTTVGSTTKTKASGSLPANASSVPGAIVRGSSTVSTTTTTTVTATTSSAIRPSPGLTKKDNVAAALAEVQRWVVRELSREMGSGNEVDVNVFSSMLMELPLDVALISDALYSVSTTIHWRRFAEEFVRRKKLAESGIMDKSVSAAAGGSGSNGVASGSYYGASSPASTTNSRGGAENGGGWSSVAKRSGGSGSSSSSASSLSGGGPPGAVGRDGEAVGYKMVANRKRGKK